MRSTRLRLLSIALGALLLRLYGVSLRVSVPRLAGTCPSVVRLNEFMPWPASGEGEWIELHNSASGPVDLTDWQLEVAGQSPYTLTATISAHGFLLLYGSQTGLVLGDWSGTLRLRCVGAHLAESYGYPAPMRGHSFSKTVDGGTLWVSDYPPSPGGPNRPATATPSPTVSGTPTPSVTPSVTATGEQTETPWPTPSVTLTPSETQTATRTVLPGPTVPVTATVTITPEPAWVFVNEFLPAARDVDWDGSGSADSNDEWIELFNAGERTVDLRGWRLDDRADGGTRPYVIPYHTSIVAGGFALFFKRDTWVGLNDEDDWVRVLRPDDSVADAVYYEHNPGYDQSFSRTIDGGGEWAGNWAVTPGEANRPKAGQEHRVLMPLVIHGGH